MPCGQPLSKQHDKIEFLKQHPELWAAKYTIIKAAMVRAGLLSNSTYVYDVKLTYLIARARGLGHRQAVQKQIEELRAVINAKAGNHGRK